MTAQKQVKGRRREAWQRLLRLFVSRRCRRSPESAKTAEPAVPFASLALGELRYRLLAPLGCGAYGEVFLARRLHALSAADLPDLLAVKRHTRRSADFAASQRLARALAGSGSPRHPLIVGLLGHVTLDADRLTLMEFCPRGDLQGAVRRCGELEAAFIALELAEALGHLHEHGVFHLDVRPCNVLLSGAGHCRLADFSLAEVRQPGHSQLRVRFSCDSGSSGSQRAQSSWLPPEIRRDGRPSPAGDFTDWFGLGALTADLVSCSTPATELGEFRHFVSRLRCPRFGQRLGSQGDVAEVLSHGFVTSRAVQLLELPQDAGVAALRDRIRRQALRPPDLLLRLMPALETAAAE